MDTIRILSENYQEIDFLTRFNNIKLLEAVKNNIAEIRQRHIISKESLSDNNNKYLVINAEINEDDLIINMIDSLIEEQKGTHNVKI